MHFPALTPRRMIGVIAAVLCTAALIPAALAATASPATAARASASAASTKDTITINSATLVARGAAIRVAFTATCAAGDSGTVNSTTTQAAGNYVAQGATSPAFTCTGTPQHISALAAANVNGAPFHLGIALVSAGLVDCPGANCTGASADKVLSIAG